MVPEVVVAGREETVVVWLDKMVLPMAELVEVLNPDQELLAKVLQQVVLVLEVVVTEVILLLQLHSETEVFPSLHQQVSFY